MRRSANVAEPRTEITGRQRGRAGAGHRARDLSGGEHGLHRPRPSTGCRASAIRRDVPAAGRHRDRGSLLGAALAATVRHRSASTCRARRRASSSMVLLVVSAVFTERPARSLPVLLLATGVPRLRDSGSPSPRSTPSPRRSTRTRVDRAVLVLNALLGLGTALAPVFVAVFVGLGFWWGLPVLSAVLLGGPARRQLAACRCRSDVGRRPQAGRARRIPPRFWLFARVRRRSTASARR